ncbi:hypothetical protein ILUMI_03254 [Ignelater luminosus]|uniref:Uncharacterized protein n=1 Tax=Ignelater luminosus TaxID=2038154 RepID=A0A8K0DGP1_IGNLU|nr:hypothetical protein ILUMI_03254 [Ignelater luminosus]
MEWYFDFVVLFVTFFVITMAMTVYVRRKSNLSRYNKYVYTGIIPKITITTCEDIPKPVYGPSEENSDDESNEEEDSSPSKQETVTVTESPRKVSLTVPDLDDDYDDEEETVEIVEIESIPAVDNKVVEEKHETIVCPQGKESKPSTEEKTGTKFSTNDDLTDTQTVPVITEDEIQLDNDDQLIEAEVINEPSPKESCLVNGFTWKYGTSHTVEDPLFPFSEAVEDDKPLLKYRFKKRLSQ